MRLFLMFALMVCLCSCNDVIKAKGDVIEREVTIAQSVSSISISGDVELVLDSRLPEGIFVIRTHSNIMPYVESTSDDKSVNIGMKDGYNYKDLDVVVTASLDQYNSFSASGSSEILAIQSISKPTVYLSLSGDSEFEGSVDVSTLNVSASGSSELDLRGACDVLNVDLSGASDFEAEHLSVTKAYVDLSGASEMEVRISDELIGALLGSSEIVCYGQPESKLDLTGGSKVYYR